MAYQAVLAHGKKDATRAAGFATPRRRRQFLVGRWLLWQGLAQQYSAQYAHWRLHIESTGKPALYDQNGLALPIAFNISHSGDWVGCALGAQGPIGLDIEYVKPRAWATLMPKLFSATERQDIASLPEADQATRCYQLWALKEALLKAQGTGVTATLSGWSFDRAQRLIATPEGPISGWQFALASLPEAVLALALAGTCLPVMRTYRWEWQENAFLPVSLEWISCPRST